MTSTPVTKLPSIAANVTKTNAAGSQIQAFGSSFSQAMDKAEAKPSEETVQSAKKADRDPKDAFAKQPVAERPVKAQETQEPQKMQEAEEAQNAGEVQTAGETDAKAPVQEAEGTDAQKTEAVLEAAKEILKKAADELHVPEEEVLAVMETLGMSMFDLFDPACMRELVLAVSGEADMLSLLTDADLYQSLQTLLATVDAKVAGLQEALSMDAGETAKFVEALKQQDVMPDTQETKGQEAPTGSVVEIAGDMPDAADKASWQLPAGQEESQTETARQDAPIEQDVPQEYTPKTVVQKSMQESKAQVQTQTQQQQQPTQHQEGKADKAEGAQMLQARGMAVSATALNPGTAPIEAPEAPVISQETRQIMNQVLDYVRINAAPGLSEMEMHLHPESLGNVRILLAAKGGIVTAQFRAESETVKAALEAQIVQLRETLDEKGVKVEAIEVTVESHAFERNLEQGNRRGGGPTEDPKKKSVRRIRLHGEGNGEAEESLALEGEDRLTAQMMAQAGNTVDFTA